MNLLIPNVKISDVHGKPVQVKGRLVVPMYHPAAALHQGSLRPVIENDFSQLPQMIADVGSPPDTNGEELKDGQEPKQLSLF